MTTDAGIPISRSVATGGDAETILSYYQTDLAGRPHKISDRKGVVTTRGLDPSTGTSLAGSSSNSSHLSPFAGGMTMKNDPFGSPAVHKRKHSNNAEDNRRVAIVPIEVDLTRPGPAPGYETGHYMPSVPNVATTLPLPLAGRGLVVDAQLQLAGSGSALVAPPDTNLSSLHDNPLSDPTPSSPTPTTPKHRSSPPSTQPAKSRSKPRIGHSKSSSRDIGIVGTRRDLPPLDLATISQDTPSEYRPPIFQTPTLRPSSPPFLITPVDTVPGESDSSAQNGSLSTAHARPAAMSASVEPVPSMSSAVNGHVGHAPPHSAHSLTASSLRHQPTTTADQGQSSPSSPTAMSAAPSSYLYYQPGVHSKAGPLPPPPRAMFDIDFNAPPPPRPPRLRSPSPLNTRKGAAGSTTPAVTVRLASKASIPSIHQIHITTTPPVDTETSSESSSYSPEPRSPDHDLTVQHTREGAFPPSTIFITPAERQQSLPDSSIRLVAEPPSKEQLPDLPTDILDTAPPINVQPPDDEFDPSTGRSSELRSEHSWVSHSNDSGHVSSESSRHAFEDARPFPRDMNGSNPSIKEHVPENGPPLPAQKGLLTSLKRYSSLPRTPSTRSPRIRAFTRSPSPSPSPEHRTRIRARSPDAMRFRDVLAKKSPSERAIGYANKINELAMYDCGLGEWLTSVKERGNSKARLVPTSPTRTSDVPVVPRVRHTSRTSISSEVTFPLRADAWIATDLSPRDTDTLPTPNVPPPALPYPALAGVQPLISFRHSAALTRSPSYNTPLAAGSRVAGGFFSSLGRNASTRKEGSKPSRLTKQPPSAPNPRPVEITRAPSVPGGPRPSPNRIQRSRTLTLAPSSSSSPGTELAVHTPLLHRRSNTLRRPSLFGRSSGPAPEVEASASAEFTRQVEKLVDLLPHADKQVLAGYLRRAGQDMLAIGQYLEDEKNGCIRRD